MHQNDYFELGAQFGELGIYFHFADLLVNLIDLADGEFKTACDEQIKRLSQRRNSVKLQMIEQIQRLMELGLEEPLPPSRPAEFYEFSRTYSGLVAESLEEHSEPWVYYICGLRYGNLILHLQMLSVAYRLLMGNPHSALLRDSLVRQLEQQQMLCDKLDEVLEHPQVDDDLRENMHDGVNAVRELTPELSLPDNADEAQRMGIRIQDAISEFVSAKTCGLVMLMQRHNLLGGQG